MRLRHKVRIAWFVGEDMTGARNIALVRFVQPFGASIRDNSLKLCTNAGKQDQTGTER